MWQCPSCAFRTLKPETYLEGRHPAVPSCAHCRQPLRALAGEEVGLKESLTIMIGGLILLFGTTGVIGGMKVKPPVSVFLGAPLIVLLFLGFMPHILALVWHSFAAERLQRAPGPWVRVLTEPELSEFRRKPFWLRCVLHDLRILGKGVWAAFWVFAALLVAAALAFFLRGGH